MGVRSWQAVAMGILLIGLTGCTKPEPPVPIDAFFPDGSWTQYQMSVSDSEAGDVKGTLKISVVGHEKVDSVNYFWIEMDQRTGASRTITKFLAGKLDAVNFSESFRFWGDVKRIVMKEGEERAQEVQELQLKRYIPSFVESKKTRRFGKAEDLQEPVIENFPVENISVNGESLECAHVSVRRRFVSRVNLGFIHMEDETEAVSEYWVSRKVPFGGLVKVEHRSSTLSRNMKNPEKDQDVPSVYQCSFLLTGFGNSGAETAITGPVDAMQAPIFPFLKDKKFQNRQQEKPAVTGDQGIVPLKKKP